jgi:hypothetical protein
VSDGIRTRDRRDHNPRDRVPQGAFLALDRTSRAFQFRLVPLKIVHEFVHEPRFRLASERMRHRRLLIDGHGRADGALVRPTYEEWGQAPC